jgi:hypothetical protein
MDFTINNGLSMTGGDELSDITAQLALLDASVVHKIGNITESIDGLKTFTSNLVVTNNNTKITAIGTATDGVVDLIATDPLATGLYGQVRANGATKVELVSGGSNINIFPSTIIIDSGGSLDLTASTATDINTGYIGLNDSLGTTSVGEFRCDTLTFKDDTGVTTRVNIAPTLTTLTNATINNVASSAFNVTDGPLTHLAITPTLTTNTNNSNTTNTKNIETHNLGELSTSTSGTFNVTDLVTTKTLLTLNDIFVKIQAPNFGSQLDIAGSLMHIDGVPSGTNALFFGSIVPLGSISFQNTNMEFLNTDIVITQDATNTAGRRIGIAVKSTCIGDLVFSLIKRTSASFFTASGWRSLRENATGSFLFQKMSVSSGGIPTNTTIQTIDSGGTTESFTCATQNKIASTAFNVTDGTLNHLAITPTLTTETNATITNVASTAFNVTDGVTNRLAITPTLITLTAGGGLLKLDATGAGGSCNINVNAVNKQAINVVSSNYLNTNLSVNGTGQLYLGAGTTPSIGSTPIRLGIEGGTFANLITTRIMATPTATSEFALPAVATNMCFGFPFCVISALGETTTSNAMIRHRFGVSALSIGSISLNLSVSPVGGSTTITLIISRYTANGVTLVAGSAVTFTFVTASTDITIYQVLGTAYRFEASESIGMTISSTSFAGLTHQCVVYLNCSQVI